MKAASNKTLKIVVAEDDPAVRNAVLRVLELEGYTVTAVKDGVAALDAILTTSPDAVVMDVMMPFSDGLSVCRELRRRANRTPVLLLTARHEVGDRVAGLDAGADDYLVKPFSVDELLARVEALHRRSMHKPTLFVEAAGLKLDLSTKRLAIGQRIVDLTPTELSILDMLMRFVGQVVTRKMLCEHVWGFDWNGPTNVIEVHINRLRGKIDRDRTQSFIQTIRGRGYALASH